MNQCLKYFSAFNIISLASHIVGNNLVNISDGDTDVEFERLFKWRSFSGGFEEARNAQKPILLLIHKPLCPSCVQLKKKFPKSVRLMDLSDRFVMIKSEMGKNSVLEDKKFQPDGKYVPRILFFTADGEFIKEACNKHADKGNKYFYKNPSQVIETMLYVLRKYSNEPLPVMFQHDQPLSPEVCDLDDIIGPTVLQ